MRALCSSNVFYFLFQGACRWRRAEHLFFLSSLVSSLLLPVHLYLSEWSLPSFFSRLRRAFQVFYALHYIFRQQVTSMHIIKGNLISLSRLSYAIILSVFFCFSSQVGSLLLKPLPAPSHKNINYTDCVCI